MRKAALAVFFACATIAISGSSAKAETLDLLQLKTPGPVQAQPVVLASLDATPIEAPKKTQPAPEPKEVKYKVVENDSLSTIAEKHSSTWRRLFNKNDSVSHPDVLKVGDELLIPGPDEQLKDRPLPEPAQEAVAAPAAPNTAPKAKNQPVAKPAAPKQAVRGARGAVAGNTYTAGNCTWYVKNKRPDLPNNLGNADTWVARARAQGMATGAAPRVGAAGQRGMHVVYVESVNGDGTVTISEMNHAGLYVITTRTLPASYFMYIY